MSTPSYKAAGVDIDAGDALVNAIKPLAAATRRRGADASLGGFGALFDLKAAGFEDPLLVATTDGVGTKLKLAIQTGIHNSVGIDLVAMCVNDLVVQGAEPLFFLDYYATGRLDVAAGKAVISGIAAGCQQAGCALIGGETAEMPQMYHDGDYDLAGFSVGAVERSRLIDGRSVVAGDVILGLAASGVHSNGFSLVRRVIDLSRADLAAPPPFADAGPTLGHSLLTPTRIYVKPVLATMKTLPVKALAHITGGGLIGNLPRVLPAGLGAVIDGRSWQAPAVFGWLQQAGGIDLAEMPHVFNCGLGMVAVVAAADAARAAQAFTINGVAAFRVGEIIADDAGTVHVNDLAQALGL